MAQFTAGGSIKPLFDGDGGARTRLEKKGVLLCHDRLGSLAGRSHLLRSKRRPRRIHAARSSSSSSSATSVHGGSGSLRTGFSPGVDVEDDYGGGAYEVCYDEDFEFHKDDLDCFRGLVLDVSYRPINVVCWRRAICLEFLEKAHVLEYYDQTVNSPSGSFYIPAVLRVYVFPSCVVELSWPPPSSDLLRLLCSQIPHLLTVVKRRRVKSTLSRKSILYRDNYTCQYCSSHENLTIDHVLPIARGGIWQWENLVTACSRCNSRKGQKTVEEANMKLMKAPKPPKDFDIVAIPLTSKAIQTLRMRKETPEEWHQYLSMPSAEL